jgi:hypothetical protein
MSWEAPMFDVVLEFLNKFVIKGTNIYFGYKDKVHVINKQLIISLECVQKGIEDLKGRVNKTLIV